METIDNRSNIFELEEIYKYKDLINATERDVIKAIIFNKGEKATVLHTEFLKIVTQEVDHKLNKEEFTVIKDELIITMKNYLDSK